MINWPQRPPTLADKVMSWFLNILIFVLLSLMLGVMFFKACIGDAT